MHRQEQLAIFKGQSLLSREKAAQCADNPKFSTEAASLLRDVESTLVSTEETAKAAPRKAVIARIRHELTGDLFDAVLSGDTETVSSLTFRLAIELIVRLPAR